jgi:thiamine biosynthesis lipoprotein
MTQSERYEYETYTMGTLLKLVLYAESKEQAQGAIDAGLTEIERLIPILNNYDANSEVSRLSLFVNQPMNVSPDQAAVLRHARLWHTLSKGTFDITVGPLTRLWSRARRERKLPSPELLDAARSRSGWQHVRWIEDQPGNNESVSVELLREGMIIDVGGIATGYIIDRAMEAIQQRGIDSLLIDIGGDIRVGRAPPDSPGWKIDIAGVGRNSPPLIQRVLEDCAITTSGDLNQFAEIEGVRYSHLIDPRTGEALRRRQSVTAIATTTIDADVGATALCVLEIQEAATLFDGFPLREAILIETQNAEPARPRTHYRHWVRDSIEP